MLGMPECVMSSLVRFLSLRTEGERVSWLWRRGEAGVTTSTAVDTGTPSRGKWSE